MATPLTRRGLLKAGGGLAAAGLLTGCSSPLATSLFGAQPESADVLFWHLFGGGDGANMTTMIGDVEKDSHLSVEPTLLSWGNPYYTKLSLAATSGRPPDVAVSHLSRLPLLARAGLLRPLDDAGVEQAGIVEDKFTPAAWHKATVDGKQYAVPLDTHPFVLYYNVDLARKAHLLGDDGGLRPIEGKEQFVNALKAMKQAGAEYGAISSNTTDPTTNWRWFMTLYAGLVGRDKPIVDDLGKKITLDHDAAEQVFAFMQELTGKSGLMPGTATPVTVSTLFGQGKAGFLFDGVWQIPTYRGLKGADGKKLNFDVRPFGKILGDTAASYADSHSLVFPRRSSYSDRRSRDAVEFVRGLLEHSLTWADGGHVPAWLPTQRSAAFAKLKPQSGYVKAAFDAVYDPPGWYTGAGSDFQNVVGATIASVQSGQVSPTSAVAQLTGGLRTFSAALPPVA
jgi:multiple sugar transport system substrate-binding protein